MEFADLVRWRKSKSFEALPKKRVIFRFLTRRNMPGTLRKRLLAAVPMSIRRAAANVENLPDLSNRPQLADDRTGTIWRFRR